MLTSEQKIKKLKDKIVEIENKDALKKHENDRQEILSRERSKRGLDILKRCEKEDLRVVRYKCPFTFDKVYCLTNEEKGKVYTLNQDDIWSLNFREKDWEKPVRMKIV